MSSEIDIVIQNLLTSRKALLERLGYLRNNMLIIRYNMLKTMHDTIKYPSWTIKEQIRKNLVAENEYVTHPTYKKPKLTLNYVGPTTLLELEDGTAIEVPDVPQFVFEAPKITQDYLEKVISWNVYFLLPEPTDGAICVETTTPDGQTAYECRPRNWNRQVQELTPVTFPEPPTTYDGFHKLLLKQFKVLDWSHGSFTYNNYDFHVYLYHNVMYLIEVVDIVSGNSTEAWIEGMGIYVTSTSSEYLAFIEDSYVVLKLNPSNIFSAMKIWFMYQGRIKRLSVGGV